MTKRKATEKKGERKEKRTKWRAAENRAKEKKRGLTGRLRKKGRRKEKAAVQTSGGAIPVGAAGLSPSDHFL